MKATVTFLTLLALLAGCSSNSSSIVRSKGSIYDGDELADSDNDFLSLEDEDLHANFADAAIPQPSEVPGYPGSGIPSLNQFKHAMAGLAQIFQNVHFNTDEYVFRNPEEFQIIDRVAQYLKRNPSTYIAIGGHCDERGSEAYNLALGTRRANYVRTLLVQRGVNANQLHSISYGKEHPEVFGHNAQAWSINRRADFKLYEK